MGYHSYVTCDCCQRTIKPQEESWLKLSFRPSQTDNRAFVHFDGKTFRTDPSGSYLSGTNGEATFDVCQGCAKRFGVTDVAGDPEFAREAVRVREAEWKEIAEALDVSEVTTEEGKALAMELKRSLGRIPTSEELMAALKGAADDGR